jgi:hypothetical protein
MATGPPFSLSFSSCTLLTGLKFPGQFLLIEAMPKITSLQSLGLPLAKQSNPFLPSWLIKNELYTSGQLGYPEKLCTK